MREDVGTSGCAGGRTASRRCKQVAVARPEREGTADSHLHGEPASRVANRVPPYHPWLRSSLRADRGCAAVLWRRDRCPCRSWRRHGPRQRVAPYAQPRRAPRRRPLCGPTVPSKYLFQGFRFVPIYFGSKARNGGAAATGVRRGSRSSHNRGCARYIAHLPVCVSWLVVATESTPVWFLGRPL